MTFASPAPCYVPAVTRPSPSSELHALIRGATRRARWRALARATALGLFTGMATLIGAALVLGPLPPRWLAAAAAAVALALGGSVAALLLRPLATWRGDGRLATLHAIGPELRSRTLSALEFGREAPATASPALLDAHLQSALDALRSSSPALRRAAPPPLDARARSLIGAGGMVLLLALALSPTRAGLLGLAEAMRAPSSGPRSADIVRSTRARLTFAPHRRLPATDAPNADHLDVPAGTTVRYSVTLGDLRRPPLHIVLEHPGGATELARAERGNRYEGEFVANQSGAITLTATLAPGRQGDPSIEVLDARERGLRVTPDATPVALILSPENDLETELDTSTRVLYACRDDVGLEVVTLVIGRPDGTEERRELFRGGAELSRGAEGGLDIRPLDLGARPGDRITLTLEAEDGDRLDGPHVGRSETRSIRVASAASRRSELQEGLDALRDGALDTLAERLERPLAEVGRARPSDAPAAITARERHEILARFERQLTLAMHTFALGEDGPRDAVRDHARRIERGSEAEERATRGRRVTAHERADAAQRDTLEDVALDLAELSTQARVETAAELARELVDLQREMSSLLAELRRADTAEARAALIAAIHRARDRMQQLTQRLSELDPTHFPADFANRRAGAQREARDALAGLERALGAGDLDAAARSLIDLEREIGQLVGALDQAEQEYLEERFGDADRAMAEALDALAGLETEQRLLAERTEVTRRDAATRALGATDSLAGRGEEIRRRARALRRQLSRLPRDAMGSRDRETLDQARERLADVDAALAQGDLGEARRMMEEGQGDAVQLAQDLRLSALMFPGRGDRTAQAAREAEAVARDVASLMQELDRAVPDLRRHVAPAEARSMRGDVDRQEEAIAAAERLAEALRHGPSGEPLDDEAAERVDAIREQMRQGRRGLQRTDPVTAGVRQREAAEALTELREDLESQSRGGGGGGGGSEGGARGSRAPEQRVEIPTADAHAGPQEFRRRVLEAMGSEGDDARGYYERLLR